MSQRSSDVLDKVSGLSSGFGFCLGRNEIAICGVIMHQNLVFVAKGAWSYLPLSPCVKSHNQRTSPAE